MTEPGGVDSQATFSPVLLGDIQSRRRLDLTGGVVPLLVAEFDLSDEVVTVEVPVIRELFFPVMSIFRR